MSDSSDSVEDLKRAAVANTLIVFENYIYAVVDAARSSSGQRLRLTAAERKLLVDQLMLLDEMLKDDSSR